VNLRAESNGEIIHGLIVPSNHIEGITVESCYKFLRRWQGEQGMRGSILYTKPWRIIRALGYRSPVARLAGLRVPLSFSHPPPP